MELGHQFQLFTPPSGPAKMTEWADVDKPMRPVHNEVDEPRSITPVHVEGYGDVHPYTGLFRSHPHERQLQMLMSAREIQQQYAPAEGDRMYKGTPYFVNGKVQPPGENDIRAGEITNRQMTTDHRLNQRWKHPATGERYFVRTSEAKLPPIETNTDMWQRKATEGAMSPEERQKYDANIYKANALATPEQIAKLLDRPPEHTTSLLEHLASGGSVPTIPLGTRSNPLSSSRKPMVAGGQHRIGVLGEIDPDRLVPVEHWTDTTEAKYITHPTRKDVRIPRPGYT